MASLANKKHTTYPSFAAEIQSPTPLSYDIHELSRILIANTLRPISPSLTKLQRNFLARCQQRCTQPPPSPSSSSCSSSSSSSSNTSTTHHHRLLPDLQNFWRLIDDAFFFSLLTKSVTLKIHTSKTSPIKGESLTTDYGSTSADLEAWYDNHFTLSISSLGQRTPTMLSPPPHTFPTITLLMYNAPSATLSSYPLALQYGISNLLHEMLHAFLDIYSCSCFRGKRKCIRKMESATQGVGVTGHGKVWCDVMCTIEDAAVREFGVGRLDCNVVGGVECEMRVAGWRPGREELGRWKTGVEVEVEVGRAGWRDWVGGWRGRRRAKWRRRRELHCSVM